MKTQKLMTRAIFECSVIFLLAVLPVCALAQTSSSIQQKGSSPHQGQHACSWPQIDSLINLGQPRSALDMTELIYQSALAAGDQPQVIKAVLYRIKINTGFQENALERAILDVRREISIAPQPAKNILRSLLAELHWRYYQENQYRFKDRTRTADASADSLGLTDITTIYHSVVRLYMQSIDDQDLLKGTAIDGWSAILESDLNGRDRQQDLTVAMKYSPTLYDFLALRAISFFSSGETAGSLPAKRFMIDQPWMLGNTAQFTRNRMAIPSDTASPASFALQIFRNLALFHMEDMERAALISVELKRLDFVRSSAIFPAKDSLYLQVLRDFETAEASSPHSSMISFSLARFLFERGQEYQPLVSDRCKWDIKSALEVCERGMKSHPGSDGAKNCERLKQSILKPDLRITTEKAVPAEKPLLALIRYNNIKELSFRLIQTDPEVYQENAASLTQDAMIRYLADQKPVQSWSQVMFTDGDHQPHSVESKIPGSIPGFYVLLASSGEKFDPGSGVISWTPFWSTNISYISRKQEDGSLGCFLLHRVTGQPLKGARAEVLVKNYDYRQRRQQQSKLYELTADNQGFIEIPAAEQTGRNAGLYLRINHGNDIFITDQFYQNPVFRHQERSYLQTRFYTDRAIYRPGQSVYFKGIILEHAGDQARVKSNHPSRVIFSDVNGQKISEQQLVSNEFGSIHGSFTAPAGVLPGQMTISNESGSVSVQVEYYKLPTFDVEFNPVEGNFRLSENITLEGKATAFAGNAVTGATVVYRVVRNIRYPWRDRYFYIPRPDRRGTEIASGTTITDDHGRFKLDFSALPDLSTDRQFNPVFEFIVTADVTDLNGETRSGEQLVSVGYKSLQIDFAVPGKLEASADNQFRLVTTNLQGRPTPVPVTFTLERLRQPDRPLKTREWERPDREMIPKNDFRSNFPYDIFGTEDEPAKYPTEAAISERVLNPATDSLVRLTSASAPLKPGVYRIRLRATDPFGQEVEETRHFTVYSLASKEVPVTGFSWFVPLKTSGIPGETAQFIIGSAEDNVPVLCEITCRDTLVSREWISINRRVTTFRVPILERYRGNFAVNFVFIRQNRVFQHSQVITVPHPDKKLDIRFETFRDKMEPGTRETWKIKISGPGGKEGQAELMSVLYDASLDQLAMHQWSFDLFRRVSGASPWDGRHAFRVSGGSVRLPHETGEGFILPPELRLNWFGYSPGYGFRRYGRHAKGGPELMMTMDMAPAAEGAEQQGVPPPPDTAVADDRNDASGEPSVIKPSPGPAALQIRRDFRETAFFYPVMVTDETGNLSLQFTVPESLTRWKWMGLAHTRDLEYGMAEKETITQKSLMVFPNAPRFVRLGDTLVFSSRIVNLSENEISGHAALDLSDALSLKKYQHLIVQDNGENGSASFSIPAGQSASVSWMVVFPADGSPEVMRYRVTARAGNTSDGEEKTIPVLSNRMMVTESLPLPVRGKGDFSFTFDKLLQSGKAGLSETLRNYRLTLEFAENPAWYAVQALPALNDFPYETAEAIFSAWWSNAVADHIANSDPAIRAVFEAWKSLAPDALKSNLAKNEDLKTTLLQETPWVMDAAGETDRKQKLGQYFDQNRIGENLTANLRKLIRLQGPGGGWSWMAGMRENRYTTQAIVTGLGKLHHLGIRKITGDPLVQEALGKAIAYLQEELVRDLREIRKYDPEWEKNPHLGPMQVQYLYAMSFFDKEAPMRRGSTSDDYREAYDFFRNQAKRHWLKQEQIMQGMIALALYRTGDHEVPALILKSLSQRALRSGEMGMYWAREAGFHWYQAPVETQAMMVEAFDEIGPDRQAVEEMKVWLLKQKQTQSWKSSRATLEACYALLLRGTSLLNPSHTPDEDALVIRVGKETVNPAKLMDIRKEPGTGYFRLTWNGGEITPEMGRVSISKNGDGVAWGALYWQYFEELDRITPAKTPLQAEKKVYLETLTDRGPELIPIAKDDLRVTLKPGDKLAVRITIKVDRDMEFVHMKDLRAAGLEPIQEDGYRGMWVESSALSGYRYQDGLGYYQSTTDAATNFFFDYLPKGSYVFEYRLRANAAGSFSNGITTLQCLYAPEFSSHSEGIRIGIGDRSKK